MNKIYDAAIVGAGPAGAVFARELARMRPELSIILIDGQSEEHKKPCGGLLAPDAQKVLAQFGLTLPNSVLADPQIFTVETIDLAARRVRYYQRHYLNMDRFRFDRWLLSLVPESVSIVRSRVEDIFRRENCFALKLSQGEVAAKTVVGADGGGSLVRRKLCGKMPEKYVSIQEWYENRGERVPYYSCIFDPLTSDSCSWTIRKDGFIIFGGAFDKKNCRESFLAQKERLEAFTGARLGDPLKREACLVTSPRRYSDLVCGGEGFYLLGEAAGFISASSYEGISSAMASAEMLASSFAESKTAGEVLEKYRKKTFSLRLKLCTKMFKRAVLCSPLLRGIIMRMGIFSVKKHSQK